MERLKFKRLNFFKGLFTKAEDWLEEQSYHIEKRKLHNRCFHAAGVVMGEGSNLKIRVDEGRLTVEPGYAVDGLGRDLYLSEPLALPPPVWTEATLYIYIAYDQKTIESRPNYTNPEYSGDAFVVEHPSIDWTDQAPDNKEKIELARINGRVGKPIVDRDIDTSRVKYAGASRLAVKVQSGDANLNPNAGQGLQFSEDDEKILIESFTDQNRARGAFYVANVFPDLAQDAGDARIFWRIESSIVEQRKIAYYLLLKNFGQKAVKVHYSVIRLNLGQ
jgi:hypothetical protein